MKERSAQPGAGLTDTLLSCGLTGVHPLFDPQTIRRAFARIDEGLVCETALMAAHDAMRSLAELDDVYLMRRYVLTLPPATVDLLVYLYFRRLDRRLIAEGPTLH